MLIKLSKFGNAVDRMNCITSGRILLHYKFKSEEYSLAGFILTEKTLWKGDSIFSFETFLVLAS